MITHEELESLLQQKTAAILEIAKLRQRLQLELENLDHDLRNLIGRDAPKRRKRVKNEKSLRQLVLEVLVKPLTLREIADTVISRGYKSNSKNFRNAERRA